MKIDLSHNSPGSRAGFSMLEMIGVLAVMAILAAITIPNALKSIERAAVRAEAETLRNLGEQAKFYLRDNNAVPNSAATVTPPAATAWPTQLGTYASLNPEEILTNRRQQQRRYVVEQVTAPAIPQRALLISSMRAHPNPALPSNTDTLPSAATIRTNFNGIWDWVYRPPAHPTPSLRPPGFDTTIWTSEITTEFLLIERINFSPVYRTERQAYSITLTNKSGGPLTTGGPTTSPVTASYQITRANSTPDAPVNIVSLATTNPPIVLYPKDRISLFRTAAGAGLDLTYVISTTGKTFIFDGTNWLPQ